MSFLGDADIESMLKEQQIRIDPYNRKRLQSASYDLTLAAEFLAPQSIDGTISIDRADGRFPVYRKKYSQDRYYLLPGHCVLARTQELVAIPNPQIMACVDGKSTLGRLFLGVHVTAGFIDPGFSGNITLEIVNFAPYTIELVAGVPICQIRFAWLESAAVRPYGHSDLGSHYQDSIGVVPPKL